MIEYSVGDCLWDMYSVQELDKIYACQKPLEWHLSGFCRSCEAVAFDQQMFALDRFYTLEDKPRLVDALKYLVYIRRQVLTRREKPLPIFSTKPAGGRGVIFKPEFYDPRTNTLIMVETYINNLKWGYYPKFAQTVRSMGFRLKVYELEDGKLYNLTIPKLKRRGRPAGKKNKKQPNLVEVVVRPKVLRIVDRNGNFDRYELA